MAVIEYVISDEKSNKRFRDLINNASIEDFVYLSNYKVPEIRCYAFIVLANKNYSRIQDIFYEHLNDSALVTDRYSDIVSDESVARYMLDKLHPVGSRSKFRFSRKEFDEYDLQIQKLEKKLKPKPEPNWNDTIKKFQHSHLDFYQVYTWGESSDKDFEEKRKLVNKPIKFIRFDKYNIIATAYFEINGCNGHFPNIEVRGDTIVLKDQILSKGHCDEEIKRIDKINFYINDQFVPQAKFVIKE